MTTFERLKKIYFENSDDSIDESKFTLDADLQNDLGLSSINLLYMAMSLEEEFGISFSNDDLLSFKTVENTIEIIDRLCKSSSKSCKERKK